MLFALPFPAISPIAFHIGPVAIYWYGLAYMVGVLFTLQYVKRLFKRSDLWGQESPVKDPEIPEAALPWAVVGLILGGRLGHVLLYAPEDYFLQPWRIFYIWEGGMAFHGGAIGVGLAMYLFCRRRRLPPLVMVDSMVAPVCIGVFLGRIANFINSELWGRVTEVPWGVIFPNGGPLPRHPSQIYEALLEGLVLFMLLRLATHRYHSLTRPGLTTGLACVGYAGARIFCEFFRTPDAVVAGPLTIGMAYSLPMILIGGVLIARARRL